MPTSVAVPKKKKKKKASEAAKAINTLKKPAPSMRRDIAEASQAQKIARKIGERLKIEFVNTMHEATRTISYLSTGHQVLDDAVTGSRDKHLEIIPGSGKGFPRGRVVEVFGKEASAKTSLALMLIKQAQLKGELAAFIDVEHALDPDFATKYYGVDMEKLLWLQPEDGEDALDALYELVEENVSVIVLDSVAALISRAEKAGGKAPGEQARLMSQAMRRLTPRLRNGGSVVMFLNQVRMKIGIVFGNPEVTSGGNALPFYSAVRCKMGKKKDIKKTGKDKGNPKTVGVRISMRIVKNKVGPPGGYCEFDLMFSKGVMFPKPVKAGKGKKTDDGLEDEASEE